MSCTSSDPVRRFLLFQIFPEMPPPAGVKEFTAAAEAPPMAMGPDGLPAKSVRFGARVGSRAGESYQNTARENPARTVLMSCGEKAWVSCRLSTWLRSRATVPKSGLMRGERLYPSSPVAAAVKVSLVEMFSSNRTVPKSSRIFWRGLLKFSAVPVGKPLTNCSGPLAAGHKR